MNNIMNDICINGNTQDSFYLNLYLGGYSDWKNKNSDYNTRIELMNIYDNFYFSNKATSIIYKNYTVWSKHKIDVILNRMFISGDNTEMNNYLFLFLKLNSNLFQFESKEQFIEHIGTNFKHFLSYLKNHYVLNPVVFSKYGDVVNIVENMFFKFGIEQKTIKKNYQFKILFN